MFIRIINIIKKKFSILSYSHVSELPLAEYLNINKLIVLVLLEKNFFFYLLYKLMKKYFLDNVECWKSPENKKKN